MAFWGALLSARGCWEGDNVPLADIDAPRVAMGAAGVVLVIAVAVLAFFQARRWLAERRRAEPLEGGIPALARVNAKILDPLVFGGGAESAHVRRRRDTVAYGFMAALEEYSASLDGAPWLTLTVMLPGRAPFLSVDHERALAGVVGGTAVLLHDGEFDALYTATAVQPEVAPAVLTPSARRVLLKSPVQRLMLRDSTLIIRSFEGVQLSQANADWMTDIAADFLKSTPSFVKHDMAGRPLMLADAAPSDPLQPGFYGPDEPEPEPEQRRGSRRKMNRTVTSG